jgi:hypothetical protein
MGIRYVTYPSAVLTFLAPYGNPTSFSLDAIRIQTPSSLTVESVGLGSTIADVIRVYGDSTFDVRRRVRSGKCVDVSLISGLSYNSTIRLSVDYRDEGIRFLFQSLVTQASMGNPMVIELEIHKPEACLPRFPR